MPVYRFRSMEEAREALWIAGNSTELAERMRKLWAFQARFRQERMPRGVYRYRSIEEANRARDRWLFDKQAPLPDDS